MSRSNLTRLPVSRPVLHPMTLKLLVVFLMLCCNSGFWAAMTAALAGSTLDILIFGIAVYALSLFTFAVVSLPWIQRPVLAVLIVVASAATIPLRDTDRP